MIPNLLVELFAETLNKPANKDKEHLKAIIISLFLF
jgi:hypothetical protein